MSNKKRAPDLSSMEVLPDESNSGKQGLEDRLQRYAIAKKHQVSVTDYILNHDVFDLKGIVPPSQKEIESLSQCSSYLYFRHYFQANEYRLIGGITCKKHFLCWPCALRRSAKFVKRYESIISQVLKMESNLVPVLITLTIRNGSDLLECFNHITGNYSKIIDRRRQELNGRRTHTVLSQVAGGAGAIEIKRGKGKGLWHVHIHQIALVDPDSFTWKRRFKKGKWVDEPVELQSELAQEWQKQTSDSHIVDVRGIDHSSDESLLRGVLEAFKYALKPGDMEIKDHIEAHGVLRGRRTVFSFGNLRGVKVSELSDDIEEELKLLPYVDLVYRFSQSGESYNFHAETDLGELPEKTLKGNPDPRRLNIQKECQSRFYSADYINNWVQKERFIDSVNKEVKGDV